jgi:cytochrome c-type biogenesis protein CcmH/NrfG
MSETTERMVSTDEALTLARKMARAGRLVDSANVLDQLLDARPDEERAIRARLSVALRKGDVDELLARVRRQIADRPDASRTWLIFGDIFQGNQAFGEAAKAYRSAIVLQPENAGAWLRLIQAVAGNKDTNARLRCSAHALVLRPEDATLLAMRGAALSTAEHVPEAIAAYQQALRKVPDNALWWTRLGNVIAKTSEFGRALWAHRKAAMLTPDDPLLYSNQSRIHLVVGDLVATSRRCRQAIQLSPNAEISEEVEVMRRRVALHDVLFRIDDQFLTANRTGSRTAGRREPFSGELSAISAAATNREPYTYFFQTDVFSERDYAEIVRNLPPDEALVGGPPTHYPERDTINDDILSRLDPERGKFWREFFERLTRPELIEAVLASLEAEDHAHEVRSNGLSLSPSVKLVRDREGYELTPHRDHPTRFATVLYYIPVSDRTDLGTSVYRPLSNSVRRDAGVHGQRKNFELVSTVPFLANSCLGFLNLGPAYHGVEPIEGDASRFTVQYTLYVK